MRSAASPIAKPDAGASTQARRASRSGPLLPPRRVVAHVRKLGERVGPGAAKGVPAPRTGEQRRCGKESAPGAAVERLPGAGHLRGAGAREVSFR
ncbi:hypothetical protein SALBM135S_04140 [Streptomyces alboniger]